LGYDKHAKTSSTQRRQFLPVFSDRGKNGTVSYRELRANGFVVCRANLSVQQAMPSDGLALDPVPFPRGWAAGQHQYLSRKVFPGNAISSDQLLHWCCNSVSMPTNPAGNAVTTRGCVRACDFAAVS